MGVVGRLNQYASMQAAEFDDYSMSENLTLQTSSIGLTPTYSVAGGTIVGLNTTATTAPNDLNEATLIDNNGNTGTNYVFGGAAIGLTTNTTYTYSIHIKQGTKPDFQITIDENGFGGKRYTSSFTYSTETVTSGITGAANDGVVVGSAASKLKNGWYRLSLTFTTSTTNVNGFVDMINRFGATSGSNYVWGRQLERGSVSTDYTPTTTTAKTRVLSSTTNTNITGFSTYYSSGFDENVGFTTFLSANISPPYDLVYDEFGGTFFGAGQGRYMRQYTDKSVIVYNEIDEVTDFRDIVRTGLVLDLDAAQPLSYKGTGTTWSDLSGNGNTGTLTNMDSTNFNSANGGYLTFDGTNEYVTCGDPSSLNFGTGNFTISFVVYTTVYGFQGGSYVGKGNGTTIGFDFRDNSFFVYGTLGLIAQGAFAATLNVWEHHTIVYDSSSSPYVKFYKNGTYTGGSTTNNSANISSINTSQPFRIGLSVAGGPTRYFNGRMPLVQAYNRALTSTEITQNYNALKHRFGL
jgi:hypothetical protein